MTAFDGTIIGYKNQVDELLRISDMIKNKENYEKLGVRIPKNAILVGGAGNGKSSSAMCFIKEAERTYFTLQRNKAGSEFIDEIAKVFSKAKEAAPSVILCDDIDHWALNRDDEESYSALQSAIDSVSSSDVFVISTANDMSRLPNSLTRSGRMDCILEFDNPKGKDLEAIVTHYLKTKKLSDDINYTDIAKMCSGGMNCSDIDNILNSAGVIAGYERSSEIGMRHIISAILKNKFGSFDLADIDADEKEKIVVHEAAHITAFEVCQSFSVGWSSIVLNDNGNYGFTAKCEQIRRRPHMIMGLLAGKVGSEIKYSHVASGCYSDLNCVSDIISEGITENAVLGFDNLDVAGLDSMSQGSMARKEAVIRAELNRYYMLTKKLLMDNMDFYNKLISAMLLKGTLLYSDIQEIKKTCKVTPLSI